MVTCRDTNNVSDAILLGYAGQCKVGRARGLVGSDNQVIGRDAATGRAILGSFDPFLTGGLQTANENLGHALE